MRVLILDIETAPSLAYIWRVWKENIGMNQVKERGYMMSYSAKWLGSDEVIYNENRHGDDKVIVKELLDLLDECDVAVAHNADRFDIPTINARAIHHGFSPPSPYRTIDTLKIAKRQFKFERNTLAHVAEFLGCTDKLSHAKFPGFELWVQCLKQNDEAWEEMRQYNIQDVLTLEEVYNKLRPWGKNLPSAAVHYDDGQVRCSHCGGTHVHKRGTYSTSVSTFQRYRCLDCGGWSRARQNLRPKSAMASSTMGI